MRVLQEREFELWEKRECTEHDDPVIGLSKTKETSRICHGSFDTHKRAEKARKKLVVEYLKMGSWQVSKESTPDTAVLFMGGLDAIIWIEEKIVSEKPFRAR
jgi:hypothetical protein